MANFPSILNIFTRPTTTDKLNSPSHSGLHNTVSSALGQVEATIGITGANSVVGTMMYDLRSPASGGGGHVQVVNKGGTGFTSFSKGDILVAKSSSVISKLSAATDGAVLTTDSTTDIGVKWKSGQVNVTSFLSNGIFTKSNGVQFVEVQAWGGGGSGGYSSTTAYGGGGGGGGAYVFARIFPSLLGTTEAVNIGVGGASVRGIVASVGSAGGNTVFGTASLVIAYGGGGGGTNGASNGGGGGGGGLYSAGTTSPSLGVGGNPLNSSIYGGGNGEGVLSYYGGAGGGQGNFDNGLVGGISYYGGAGGGGGSYNGSGAAGGVSYFGGGNGGAGGGGDVIATAGSIPGGGGGGSLNAKSGEGGKGKVIICEYF